ncbi:hypothetical protein IWW36_003706 [Coemansia brasiliensis]|uniref:Uncharacterized protein n=1 Tax=Coemansia brasiliensis TaxID=2650707 RepID=A0A9W8LYA4_9FUNG|nr:hypothetical protein IWW36_003706 [Coemansia brasiliensis]
MLSTVVASTLLGSALVAGAQDAAADNMASLLPSLIDISAKPMLPVAGLDTSFTGNIHADIKHADEIAEIYCPELNCSSYRDWLTHPPKAAASWVLGAISLIIGLISCRFYIKTKGNKRDYSFSLPPAGAAMFLLCISLFLRASLTLSTGNKLSMHVASLAFNYFTGLTLCGATHVSILRLKTLFQPPTTTEKAVNASVRGLFNWCPLVLFIVGLVYSFNLNNTNSAASGMHCIQAALVMIICIILAVNVYTCWRIKAVVRSVPKKSIFSAVVFTLLLLLWATFMLARSFVSLHNVARTSDALYGMLNYGVFIVCGIVARVFGHPLETPDSVPVNASLTATSPCPGQQSQIESSTDSEEVKRSNSSSDSSIQEYELAAQPRDAVNDAEKRV